jgi:hypothetical protein
MKGAPPSSYIKEPHVERKIDRKLEESFFFLEKIGRELMC